MSQEGPLLEVENLEKHYPITEGILGREVGRVRAVDGMNFTIDRGEAFGLVGESGCGKSTAATTLLHLEEPTGGTVRFAGEDVTAYGPRELKRFRRRAQLIFQDPDSSFDPRMTIGQSVGEPLLVHGLGDRERRRGIVEDLLVRVGLDADDADRYPHEFSRGQRQRIALARALSVNPDLLIADEPVSALDVSTQAEILSTIADLQAEFGLAVLFISHDLGVVREICDRVGVMYLGELLEVGPTEDVFADPRHPYTRALVDSIPTPDPHDRREGSPLVGDVPSPSNPPLGCRFHPRCPELIRPEGSDLDRETWRSVATFTARVTDRSIDPDAVAASIAAEDDAVTGVEAVSLEAFDSRLRERFGIPAPLPDRNAEAAVRRAIERLFEDDLEGASHSLGVAFETVCRQKKPGTTAITADHCVACHLVEEASTRSPPPDVNRD